MKVWRCVGKLVERKNNLMRRRCWGSCFYVGRIGRILIRSGFTWYWLRIPGLKGRIVGLFVMGVWIMRREKEGLI
jgi:hypothetical protein